MNAEEGMRPSEANRDQTGDIPGLAEAVNTTQLLPNFSDMMEDLSFAESKLATKFNNIRRWQESTNFGPGPTHERKIQSVFQACTGYYSILLPAISNNPHCSDEEKIGLRRNFKLLRNWGEAYSVPLGQLDQLAGDARETTDTILLFLIEISSILSRRIPHITRKWKVEDSETLSRAKEILQSLIHHILEADHDDDERSTNESPTNELEMSADTLQQCITDIEEYVQLLNELHSTIESYLPLVEDVPDLFHEKGFDHAAYKWYSEKVRLSFNDAPDALVDQLGRLNLERYKRLAESRDAHLGDEDNSHEVPMAPSIGLKSASFYDSGIGSSIPSMRVPSIGAPSMFSALAGKSRTKLPPLPTQIHSFSCDFCGRTVRFLKNREWHKHLIEDLLPYSCLDPECSFSSQPFQTREEWIKHLDKDHNMGPDWPPQKCNLCQQLTRAGKIEVCKHFADHLEDIACAAAPLDVLSEDGSEADSTKSHGIAGEEALRTISEEPDTIEDLHAAQSGPVTQESTIAQTPSKLSDLLPNLEHELQPNCPICNADSSTLCLCVNENLQIAVKQAEHRWLESKLVEIREWAINHSRHHILAAFERLTDTRKQSHAAYLSSLPNYAIYMQYSGHPPIHPAYISQLQGQVAEAHAELKCGIDADWRASTLRYPEMLDYFYGLVEVRVPSERSPQVSEPPFAFSGYNDSTESASWKKKRKLEKKEAPENLNVPLQGSPN